jgi:hypothetical protein
MVEAAATGPCASLAGNENGRRVRPRLVREQRVQHRAELPSGLAVPDDLGTVLVPDSASIQLCRPSRVEHDFFRTRDRLGVLRPGSRYASKHACGTERTVGPPTPGTHVPEEARQEIQEIIGAATYE